MINCGERSWLVTLWCRSVVELTAWVVTATAVPGRVVCARPVIGLRGW